MQEKLVDPEKRVAQNLKEGRFRFDDALKPKGGIFDFASSNELWRASLDVIDFMPLSSVNYSEVYYNRLVFRK